MTCVPVVVAGSPWQRGAEGEDQVEQGPCQDDDVGHAAVEEDQLTTIADTCKMQHVAPNGHSKVKGTSSDKSH